MNSLQWYDFVRFATMALSLISLYQLGRRAYYFWQLYTSYLKDMWLLLVGFQVLLVEGGIEQIIGDVPGGPRTIIALLLSAICVRVTGSKDVVFLSSWEESKDYTDPGKSKHEPR